MKQTPRPSSPIKHALADLQALAERGLQRAGALPAMARATAQHLVIAQAQGLLTHGLSRVEPYTVLLNSGRHDGKARPKRIAEFGATCLIDAADGLAYEAVEMALDEVTERANKHGIALAGVTNSGHCGVLGLHVAALAKRGLIGLALANTPAGVNAWGGKRALFGVDPIAAAFPRQSNTTHVEPLVVDLAPTTVVRGQILLAIQKGESIPEGWAMDAQGQPTTDPRAALAGGSLYPIGGAKGAMLSLVFELFVAGLTGSRIGREADSLFGGEGNRPRLGHTFIAVSTQGLAGDARYFERVEALVSAMLEDEGVRLPGARRDAGLRRAQAEGLAIDDALYATLQRLAT